MKIIARTLLVIFISSMASMALAQDGSSTPAVKKQYLSVSLMALTSSTTQGGQGPSGSTTLSQSEYVYGWPRIGFGAFFLYDMQGSNQKDSAYGPKVEIYLFNPFYLEAGYAVTVTRAFTDRTISQQTGTGLFYGAGVRFKLGAAGGGGGGTGSWFFQASYKMRTQTLTKQDSTEMTESIIQTDSYPLVGIGYQF